MPRPTKPKSSIEGKRVKILFNQIGYNCLCAINDLCKCTQMSDKEFAKERALRKDAIRAIRTKRDEAKTPVDGME